MKIRPTDICIFLSHKHCNAWITYQGRFNDRGSFEWESAYRDLSFKLASPDYFVIRVDAVNAELWKAFK